MIDPLFFVFVALSVGVVAGGWILLGKVAEQRPEDGAEMQVERPLVAASEKPTSEPAPAATVDVPAPITRMARVDVAEMHAEIEQFLREQHR